MGNGPYSDIYSERTYEGIYSMTTHENVILVYNYYYVHIGIIMFMYTILILTVIDTVEIRINFQHHERIKTMWG